MRSSAACLFGAIADDYTGGSDLAGMLCEQGISAVQIFGLQPPGFVQELAGRYQAVVVCLKSRSIPPADARRLSLDALGLLQLLAPAQVQFKYCSTFDSTPEGNIGPITEALMERLDADFTIAVPALPVNGRTQYLGHLFVGQQLLSDSPMRNHPISPMTDSNLVRHLQRQTSRRVGLIPLEAVRGGAGSIHTAMDALRRDGVAIALVDAIADSDLVAIAQAAVDLKLITGGSGLGMKLPAVWRSRDLLVKEALSDRRPVTRHGSMLILSGSCSTATLRQVECLRQSDCHMIEVDVRALVRDGTAELDRLTAATLALLRGTGKAAVYSSAPAEARLEGDAIPHRIEWMFGELARRLVIEEQAAARLVVAGGETSGAVINSLCIPAVEVAGIIDPGVPLLRSLGEPALALALKSGNFGSPDFFIKAMHRLEEV